MRLTKEQTMKAFYLQNKMIQNENRFKFSSKIKTKCLKCHKSIYVSYFENSPTSIFCDLHKTEANPKNIAQLQYLRFIKEKQLKILTSNGI